MSRKSKVAQSNPPRSLFLSGRPWIAVLAVVLLTSCIRFHLRSIPLERDEGEYAYVGQLLLQGIPPYQLAYNMKLPGTYLAYAAGMAVFGQSINGVHLTLMVVNALTIAFVFLLGRELLGAAAGVMACLTFGIISLSPAVLGLAAHANHFVILFAVPAVWLLWRAVESNGGRALFFSGLLFGMAFLMKQQGVCFCLFGCVFLAVRELRRKKPRVWGDTVKRFSIFGAGLLLPLALACLWLAAAGVFPQFWFWTFTYARHYVERLTVGEGALLLAKHLASSIHFSGGLWALALLGLLPALVNPSLRKQAVFCAVFWGFAFAGTAIGWYFREHYFILLLPAFALLCALAVCALEQILRRITPGRVARGAPPLLLAVLLAWNLFAQRLVLFQPSASRAGRIIYWANPVFEAVDAGNFIREHSRTNSSIAIWGSEPQIFFYAHRHSATGYIYMYPLMETQPYAAMMQRQMLGEIESNQPEYALFVGNKLSWLATDQSDDSIIQWFFPYVRKYYDKAVTIDNPAFPLDSYMVLYQRKPSADAGAQNGRPDVLSANELKPAETDTNNRAATPPSNR